MKSLNWNRNYRAYLLPVMGITCLFSLPLQASSSFSEFTFNAPSIPAYSLVESPLTFDSESKLQAQAQDQKSERAWVDEFEHQNEEKILCQGESDLGFAVRVAVAPEWEEEKGQALSRIRISVGTLWSHFYYTPLHATEFEVQEQETKELIAHFETANPLREVARTSPDALEEAPQSFFLVKTSNERTGIGRILNPRISDHSVDLECQFL